ncbi:MAG: hypothetical protein WC592_06815 [Candidatus Omnitrophota bacterium]|nr:hypothetical protein [Candidatus Omnitrophota bacterium]
MNKKMKIAVIAILAVAALYFICRHICIRVVNYEIAGMQIPSRYNIITGKITPLASYNKKGDLKTVQKFNTRKLGLSEDQVTIAKFRWAIFEEWANSRPEYKGWQDNEELFKKANDAFKNQISGKR